MSDVFDAKYIGGWSKDISVRWTEEDFKDNNADIFVTPGNIRGHNIIHFSNNVNSDSFDVLVIVK